MSERDFTEADIESAWTKVHEAWALYRQSRLVGQFGYRVVPPHYAAARMMNLLYVAKLIEERKKT